MTAAISPTRLDLARQRACPFGVADKCLGDGCQAWVPGYEWRSVATGEPDPPEEKRGFFARLFSAGGISVAPRVFGVEHGRCSRIKP